MKKVVRNFVIAIMLFMSFGITLPSAFGQSPQKFSYQGVIRNAANALVTTPVSMRVSILDGTTEVYAETFTNVQPNVNGLVTVEIGGGTPVGAYLFTNITWGTGTFSVKTETDATSGTGTTYTIVGTSNLLSVPFSLYSLNGTPGPQGIQGPVGPAGPTGADGIQGPQGPAGVLAVNCLECHKHTTGDADGANSSDLVSKANEMEFSKHFEGKELALEEGYSVGCSPCHSHEGFMSVVTNNVVPAMITSTSADNFYNTTTPKYAFSYDATAAASSALTSMPGAVGCWTCHSAAPADSMGRLQNASIIAGVKSCMWGGTKTLDIATNNHESNLCLKCHQPRPMSRGSVSYSSTNANYMKLKRVQDSTLVSVNPAVYNGNLLDYDDLATNPTAIFYDSTTANFTTNKLFPSYRSHTHYGAVGTIVTGTGAVEFTGATGYAPYNDLSTHRTAATCQMCHMSTPKAVAVGAYGNTTVQPTGGHTFIASINNLGSAANGCKVTGCHSSTFGSTTINNTMNAHKAGLANIAAKLKTGGIEIMHKNTDLTANIFAGLTTAGYDGYLDIYDPSTNPTGAIRNPIIGGSWTAAQRITNRTKTPLKSLKNVEWGAILNFQILLREFSNGIHNPKYSQALIQNTLQALTDAGL